MENLESRIKRYFKEKGLDHNDLHDVGLADVQRFAMDLEMKIGKAVHWVKIRRKMSEYINNEIRSGEKHD